MLKLDLNAIGLASLGTGIGSLVPFVTKMPEMYSIGGIAGVVALAVGFVLMVIIPPATAAKLEHAFANDVIPAAEALLPAEKPVLEAVKTGLNAAADIAAAAKAV